jgi:hypothetical protein
LPYKITEDSRKTIMRSERLEGIGLIY